MKNNQLNSTTTTATPHFKSSTATERVHARTEELALLAGRHGYEINQRDYEQAKREITGESDFDKQQVFLNKMQSC